MIDALGNSGLFSSGAGVQGGATGIITNFTSARENGVEGEAVVGVVSGGVGRRGQEGGGRRAIGYSAVYILCLVPGFACLVALHVITTIRGCLSASRRRSREEKRRRQTTEDSLNRDGTTGSPLDLYCPSSNGTSRAKRKKKGAKGGSRRGGRRSKERSRADVVRAREEGREEANDEADHTEDGDLYTDNDLRNLVSVTTTGSIPRSRSAGVWRASRGGSTGRAPSTSTAVDRTSCLLRLHRGGLGTLVYLYVFFALPEACEIVYSCYCHGLAPGSPVDRPTTVSDPTSRVVFYAAISVSRVFSAIACGFVQPNFLVLTHLSLGVGSSVVLAVYGSVYTPVSLSMKRTLVSCQ